MEFLKTERLILRDLEPGDFEDFYLCSRDLELCRMLGRDPVTDRESAMPTFQWLLEKEPRAYGLILRENGRLIGNLTVTEPSQILTFKAGYGCRRGCALSFALARAYRRRGLMTEALHGVLDQLFLQEHYEYVNCGFFDFNTASRALQEKLGFHPAAEETFTAEGERFHVIEQALFREDWKG